MKKLIFKYATMNSGKSIDLIKTAYNYRENGKKIIIMKPSIDTKGKTDVVTRIGLTLKTDYTINKDTRVLELLKGKLQNIECILIDESQFLEPNQVDDLFLITKVMDIPVICYGLRNDFRMDAFPGSRRLLELSDRIEAYKTICHCGNIAYFVGRKVNGKYVTSGNVVLIDGSEENVEYVPLCGNCYLKEVKKVDFQEMKEYLS